MGPFVPTAAITLQARTSVSSTIEHLIESAGNFFSQLANLSWFSLLLGLALYAVYLLLRSRALTSALRAAYPGETVRWRDVWGAYMVGYAINNVFPLGGGNIAQLFLTHLQSGGTTATIYHQNVPIKTIDLDQVDTPHSFTIYGEGGAKNVVLIEPGQISIHSATCPDQICVHQGPIEDGTHPIVCLPHRVVIQIDRRPGDHADAVGGQP